jgi:hypothetical protein
MVTSTLPNFGSLLHQGGVLIYPLDPLPPNDEDALLTFLQMKKRDKPEHAQELLNRLKFAYNEEVSKVHFINFLFSPPSRSFSDMYSMHMDLEWTAIKPKFATNLELPKPKPDYFEAFRITEFHPTGVKALAWRLQPSSHFFAMPTLCVEFKGPGGNASSARLQAANDGAVMVEAAWDVHKYMKRPAHEFLGQTKALVIALADTFELFACHAMPAGYWDKTEDTYPPKLSFHVFRLVVLVPGVDLEVTARWIQNAQDWARAQAESMKEDIRRHFDRSDHQEEDINAEERKKNDALRVATNTKKRKAELEQDRPSKKRTAKAGSDDGSGHVFQD